MGDGTKPDSGREWTALAGLGESFDEFDELAGPLIRGGPPPAVGVPAIARAPMIIDTDIGGDPDDTVAVVVVARQPDVLGRRDVSGRCAAAGRRRDLGGERGLCGRRRASAVGGDGTVVESGDAAGAAAGVGGADGGHTDGRGDQLPRSIAG